MGGGGEGEGARVGGGEGGGQGGRRKKGVVVAELRRELLLRRIVADGWAERRSWSDRVTGRDRPETEQAPWGAALDVAVNLDNARRFEPLP